MQVLSHHRFSFHSFCASLLLTALLLSFAPRARAEAVHTPRAGSAERKVILDSLRAPVQRKVGQRVIFVVNILRVKDGWAFFEGSARRSTGQSLGQKYLWGETSALLRRSGGRWQVLRWGFATDTGLMEQYKRSYPNAPRAIFP